jgi:3D (Asp-Asp-Asp) domain-containing protein
MVKILFNFFLVLFLLAPQSALALKCECFNEDGLKFFYNCEPDCSGGICGAGGLTCSPSQVPEVPEIANPEVKKANQFSIDSPDLSVAIPGLQLDPKNCTSGEICEIDWTAKYAKAVFDYGVLAAIVLSIIMIMVGGLIWLMSGGRQDQIGKAKEFITGALSGLLLTLFSVIILQAINPGLVDLDPLRIVMPNLLETQAKDRQQANTESEAVGGGNCPSSEDQASGFQSIATSYSRPVRSNFGSDRDFLCAVGLNCWCPNDNARDRTQPKCPGGLHPCMPFDPNTTAYCNQTASGSAPGPGQVAADRRCFPMGTKLCVNGSTYTVTDTGSAIVGTRLDIWNDNYGDAVAFGRRTVNVTVGPCP